LTPRNSSVGYLHHTHTQHMEWSVVSTGDLVFVAPPLHAADPLDRAILDVGAATINWLRAQNVTVTSNITVTHVALAWHNESGDLHFVEAVPPVVTVTPAESFWHSSPPGTTFYHGTLTQPRMDRARSRAVDIARQQIGKPYSSSFAPPPDAFYCSSLVDFAYAAITHEANPFVPAPFTLIFVPEDFWKRYYEQLNITLPTNVTGTNPTLLLHSTAVNFTALPQPAPSRRLMRGWSLWNKPRARTHSWPAASTAGPLPMQPQLTTPGPSPPPPPPPPPPQASIESDLLQFDQFGCPLGRGSHSCDV